MIPAPGDSLSDYSQLIRQIDALIMHVCHIPFPEDLDDSTWVEKYRQVQWLAEQGLIGVKSIPVLKSKETDV